MVILAAPWLLPMEGPPVEGGALLISGGRIAEVGRRSDLTRAHPGLECVDLDGCALLPPLANAHAHLELTGLGPAEPGGDFVDWILTVIALKRAASAALYEQGIRSGAAFCLRNGQGVVADVLSTGASAVAYPAEGPEIRVFLEIIAPRAEDTARIAEQLGRLALPRGITLGGLSPHAPYTVGEDAYRCCLREAERLGGALMTHLSESLSEEEFCLAGSGALARRLYARVPSPPPAAPGARPFDALDRQGVVGPRSILVHAVHLTPEEVERVARRGARVVLCPRSNRNLGVGTAPGRAFLDAGVAVGLGTDSLLSAGDLDLWKDIRQAVSDYGWSPAEALDAATRGGCEVLGMADQRGRFASGRRADILAARLSKGGEPWEAVLEESRPEALWLGGMLRFGDPALRSVEYAAP